MKRMLLLAICCFFATNSAFGQLENGLEGYWQFNVNALDSSEAARDLDLVGNPGFGTGLIGCALDLNGNPSQYSVGATNETVFNLGGDEFTIQVWVNFSSTGGEQTLFEKFTGGSGPGYTLTKLPNNRIQFFAHSLAVINSPVLNLETGVWHHIVMRRIGNSLEMFLDDQSVIQSTHVGSVVSSPNPIQIGERQGPQQFGVNGLIDEVAFWKRGISNAEITQLFNDRMGFALVSEPKIMLGDVNLDGMINLLDIDPFVALITEGSYQAEADLNEDCQVNLLDVEPFIGVLSGG